MDIIAITGGLLADPASDAPVQGTLLVDGDRIIGCGSIDIGQMGACIGGR